MSSEVRQRPVTRQQSMKEKEKVTNTHQLGTTKVMTRAIQKNQRETVARKTSIQTKKQVVPKKTRVLCSRPTQVNAQPQTRVKRTKRDTDNELTKQQVVRRTQLCVNVSRPIDRKKVVSKPAVTLAVKVKPGARMVVKTVATTVPDLIADSVIKSTTLGAETARTHIDHYAIPTTPKQPLVLLNPDQSNDNPQLCTEYIKEIYTHLLVTERKMVYRIQEDFMAAQIAMKAHHRAILVDWLMQVKMRYELLDETMYMCVEIIDRTIQVDHNIRKTDLQLVGITSLFIASKYEEVYPPSLSDFVYVTADTYTKQQVLTKEIDILKKLDYQLNNPFALTFLRRYSKVMETTSSIHGMAKYILELSFLDPKCCCLLPSKRAAAALLLALSIHAPQKPSSKLWDDNMAYHTKYKVKDLHDTKLKLRESLKEGHNHQKLTAIRKKFTSSRNCTFTILNALSRL